MADPAFMQKMLVEQAITISASLAYEARVRGDAFWSELDLVVSNTLCLAAANAALVYLVAPTRAAPAPQRFEWQNAVSKLPNNAFERCAAPGTDCAAPARRAGPSCAVPAPCCVRLRRWQVSAVWQAGSSPLASRVGCLASSRA